MCLECEPYRPGREDTVTNTVEDAARFERERADVDRPQMSDLSPEDAR